MISLLFSKWKMIAAGLAALAVVTTIGLTYRHYTGLLSKVETLQTNNTRLQTAVDEQTATIDAQEQAISEWQESQDELIARVEELQRIAQEANREVRRLNGIFSRHDLTELARKKPGLIERRINDGTDRIGRMLHCATGAEGEDCAGSDRPPGGASSTP